MTERGDGSVAKACEVLEHVAAYGRPVRFGELLEHSPFPKATLYRYLQSLTRQGMLSLDPDRQTYAPGLRLVRLAHAAWTQASLAPVARPHIDALSEQLGETVHLAQLDQGQVLYVDKRNARQPVQMFSAAGKVGPAYCTGVGKAMLAFLKPAELETALSQQSFHRYTSATITSPENLRIDLAEIRARGHAFDREEHEPGIVCVAAPILSRVGRVLGALSVTSTTAHLGLDGLEEIAPALRQTAAKIAEEAENWRFPDRAAAPKPQTAGT